MNANMMVHASEVQKFYGDFPALRSVSLDVHEGQVVVICGPSGSGKSTLLRCINGLERMQGGDLVVDGLSVRDPRTDLTRLRSEVGMVFQSFNLYPHMTALRNITLAPTLVQKMKREEADTVAHEFLHKVSIPGEGGDYPGEFRGATSAVDPEIIHEVLNVILALGLRRSRGHDHGRGDPRDGLSPARLPTASCSWTTP